MWVVNDARADPMVAAFVSAMWGPAQAYDTAALAALFPRANRSLIMGEPNAVTIDDQRRWEGIVRDWDTGSPTVLTQINTQLRDQFPAEWSEPYKDFVYGFRGLIPAQDVLGVCGQWVAYRAADGLHLYASVPGTIACVYQPGDNFNVSALFPREKLRDSAGFAELWQAVRESRERLLHLMETV